MFVSLMISFSHSLTHRLVLSLPLAPPLSLSLSLGKIFDISCCQVAHQLQTHYYNKLEVSQGRQSVEPAVVWATPGASGSRVKAGFCGVVSCLTYPFDAVFQYIKMLAV